MKEIVYNNENLTEEEIQRTVNKVRGVILNKDGHILITKYAGMYLLVGGAIDEGENEIEALKREILEETGIQNITPEDNEPFLSITDMHRNYYDRDLKVPINRKTETKYYYATTEEDVDLSKANFTEHEKSVEFKPFFVNPTVLEYMITENKSDNPKHEIFKKEILTVLKEFKNYRSEKEQAQR